MTDLRQAVRSVIDRWDSPRAEFAASDLFEELRAQLEQPEQPEQRKLLTGEQIEFAWMKAMQSTPGTTLPIHEFARAIEAAHGIKDTP